MPDLPRPPGARSVAPLLIALPALLVSLKALQRALSGLPVEPRFVTLVKLEAGPNRVAPQPRAARVQ